MHPANLSIAAARLLIWTLSESTSGQATNPSSATTWECKVIQRPPQLQDHELNQHGRAGWDLMPAPAHADHESAPVVFKRAVRGK